MSELELLREFRSDSVDGDADLERPRRALELAIESEAVADRKGRERQPFPRIVRRRTALIAAVACVAALGLAVAFLPADNGGPNQAVAALQRVAVVAGDQPQQSPPEPGQYLYTKQVIQAGPDVIANEHSLVLADGAIDPFDDPSLALDMKGARAGVPRYTIQLWATGPGGEPIGRRVTDLDRISEFAGVPIDEQARSQKWNPRTGPNDPRCAVPSPPPITFPNPPGAPSGCDIGPHGDVYDTFFSRHSDVRLNIGLLPPRPRPGEIYQDLSGLPTDPEALRAEILKKNNTPIENPSQFQSDVYVSGGTVATFAIAGDLLSTPGNYAPPEVRQALYEVVAELPDVQLIGEVADPLGRHGVAVALTHNGIQRELIFDPRTSALLARRDLIAYPALLGLDASPGTMLNYTAYVASGVVDSSRERRDARLPDGAERPPR